MSRALARFEVAYGEARTTPRAAARRPDFVLSMGCLGPDYVTLDNAPGWGAKFPQTGWAPLEDVRAQKWARVEPRPVKIIASRFMITDKWSVERWFDLRPRQFIQGLLATLGADKRVYVVTVPVPGRYGDDVAERTVWPRIVTARGSAPYVAR